MNRDIRILYLEDEPADVAIAQHALRRCGLIAHTKRVETQEAFLRELQDQPPDLILSDRGWRSFDGFAALAIARAKCPDVPFIFVTNALGEPLANKAFELGATGCVLKSDISKLTSVIQRVLREADERTTMQRVDEALHIREEGFRRLVEHSPDAVLVHCDGRIVFANAAAARLLRAARPEQLIGTLVKKIVHPSYWKSLCRLEPLVRGGTPDAGWPWAPRRTSELNRKPAEVSFVDAMFQRLDGTAMEAQLAAIQVMFRNRPAVQMVVHDRLFSGPAIEALRQSASRLGRIFETAFDAIVSIDAQGRIQEWNAAARRMFGYDRAEALGRTMDELIVPRALREVYRQGFTNYLLTGVGSLLDRPIELTLRRSCGDEFRAELAITRDELEKPSGFTALIRDITERK